MKRPQILGAAMILLIVLAAVMFLIFGGGSNVDSEDVDIANADTALEAESNSIEGLRDVAMHIDPETYMRSSKLRRFEKSPAAHGKVLFPEVPEGSDAQEPDFIRQTGYVGPESCRECHADMYEGFIQTAHYKTSSLPGADSTLGTFNSDEDALTTKVRGFRYDVLCEGEDYFQVVKIDRNGETYKHKQRIDIITGSGNHGQTHLYWKDSRLYELPVSWFTSSGWVNSPGFNDGFADFARPIHSGCVACHATLFEEDATKVNHFDRDSVILGVTCEKCHGPGKEHVEYHQNNPEAGESKFIVHPDKLPRERMNDVCGQCHTGKSQLKQSMFGFRPGDNIHDFKTFPEPSPDGTTGKGGVHSANQHPRLLKSRCYLEASSMNCATCHNPHQQEHGNVKLFSKRCMECHEMEACGQFASSGKRIASNCIDCHMPKRKDSKTKMVVGEKTVFPEIRDHFIRVQMDATKLVLDAWEKEEANSSEQGSSSTEQNSDAEIR